MRVKRIPSACRTFPIEGRQRDWGDEKGAKKEGEEMRKTPLPSAKNVWSFKENERGAEVKQWQVQQNAAPLKHGTRKGVTLSKYMN